MPGNESSFRVYFMGTVIKKLFVKNGCGFYKYWKPLLVKNKKITVNYALTRNQIDIYLRLF